MAATFASPSGYRTPTSLRERGASLLLALVFGIAIIVALWKLGGIELPRIVPMDALHTFQVLSPAATPHQAARATPKPRTPPQAHRPQPTPRTAPPPPTPPTPFPAMRLSSQEFASTDIDKMRHTEDAPAATASTSGDAATGKVYGPSEGPSGHQLFAADWYREPTNAEISPYIKGSLTEGWGMVACQTIERYHVDNCRELGESPGSGLARTLRQAAFQFLVRPPSVDGKPMIGVWVRIKFDLVRGVVK